MMALLAAALGVGEILLIVACALIVVSVVTAAIIRKVKGKTGCGGDCGCCSGCSQCKSFTQGDDVKEIKTK